MASPENLSCFQSDCGEQQGGETAQHCGDFINGYLQTEDGEGVSQKISQPKHHPGNVLTLRLGLTCYKDYLGTNWSGEVAELRRRGQEEFGDPLALFAQPLGVGAVLCTCDGQVVFIRRSQKVAEAGGLLDIPGGHPEPKVTLKE